MFEIGERVVCIDDSKQPHTVEELNKDVPNWVRKGQKYTIRAIHDWDFVVGILLEEIKNDYKYFKVVDKFAEPAFASWRFRKLEPAEMEEDIKIEQLDLVA